MVIKKLVSKYCSQAGRNSSGKIVIRSRCKGHKKRKRIIDFFRNLYNSEGTLVKIEYDPLRNCFLGVIFYKIGCISYIILPENLRKMDKIISINNGISKIKVGVAMPLLLIPVGTIVHNIENIPLKGGKYIRSKGTRGVLFQKYKTHSGILLPSGKVRFFLNKCMATIGSVSRILQNKLVNAKKAGFSYRKGIRPVVRGVAKNAVDHVHGGGHSISASYNKNILKGKKTRKKFKNFRFLNIKRRIQKGLYSFR
jgi:large subunit ribosomal protein L2